jgi:hypothetical protein
MRPLCCGGPARLPANRDGPAWIDGRQRTPMWPTAAVAHPRGSHGRPRPMRADGSAHKPPKRPAPAQASGSRAPHPDAGTCAESLGLAEGNMREPSRDALIHRTEVAKRRDDVHAAVPARSGPAPGSDPPSQPLVRPRAPAGCAAGAPQPCGPSGANPGTLAPQPPEDNAGWACAGYVRYPRQIARTARSFVPTRGSECGRRPGRGAAARPGACALSRPSACTTRSPLPPTTAPPVLAEKSIRSPGRCFSKAIGYAFGRDATGPAWPGQGSGSTSRPAQSHRM